MNERPEPLVIASGQICVCGCIPCRGPCGHCLHHDTGCHLLEACDYQIGMICCTRADQRKAAAAVSDTGHLARITRAALSSGSAA
jgi:hypothetical protein